MTKRILALPAGTEPAEADEFMCVQDTAGTPVTRRLTFAVLLRLFSTLFKGTWSGATTYTAGQIVERNGSAYQATATSLNHAPPNASYWALFNSKGDTGAAGSTWRQGAGAPSNGLGSDGDFYLRTSNDDIYLKDGGVYSLIGNFKGATGAAGADGADGSDSELTVHQSSVAGSEVTGVTETTIATITVPVLGANDAVFFAAVFTRSVAAANTVLRAYHGGNIIATFTVDISAFTSIPLQHLFSNQNNVASQLGGLSEALALIEGAVNTGSTSTLAFKVENGDSMDTITLRSLTVKVIKP